MRTIKTRHFTGTTDNTVTKRELDNRKVARRAAAEGMVLLKNEGILPLKEGTKIALYGVGASRTIKVEQAPVMSTSARQSAFIRE